jgi:hypothetical protein
MDELGRLEAKGLARAKIRSKRRRVSLIRRRAISGSLILFAAAWAIVFGQLVTGNDPVLSRTIATRRLAASTHRVKRATHAPPRSAQEPAQEGVGAPVVSSNEPGSEEAPPPKEPAPHEETTPSPAPTPAPAPIITSAS